MRKALTIGLALAAMLAVAGFHSVAAQGLEAPRGPISSRWMGGNLIFYPGDVAGNMYFVDSNSGSNSNSGLTWDYPLATIDAAVNKCTASHDDWIVVHPSHAENLAADSAIDIDQAGVTVWGIRHGRLMPTLTATATAGDCKLAAAGVTIANLRFLGGIDATTGCIEVSGADCAIIDCEYRDVTGQATDVLITTAGGDRLLVDGFRCLGAAGAGANSAIALVGADDTVIRNFGLYGNFAVGAIDLRTTASNRIAVHDGWGWTENAADVIIVDTITASTGIIGPNVTCVLQDDDNNITECVAGTTFFLNPVGVEVTNAPNEAAIEINWTACDNN